MTHRVDLKPCPFCGHFPFHRQLVNDGRWETSCQTAACIRPGTGIRRSEAEAIAAWNARAALEVAGVAELREDAEFLCARVRELEGEMRDDDELTRQYFGHVLPALARMESALANQGKAQADG